MTMIERTVKKKLAPVYNFKIKCSFCGKIEHVKDHYSKHLKVTGFPIGWGRIQVRDNMNSSYDSIICNKCVRKLK